MDNVILRLQIPLALHPKINKELFLGKNGEPYFRLYWIDKDGIEHFCFV